MAGWEEWEPSRVRQWAAWAALQVNQRHARVLDLLAAHPLLSRTDLAAVLNLDVRTVSRYLAHLERVGLASTCRVSERADRNAATGRQRSVGGGDASYLLTQPGVYLLAASAGIPMRRIASSPIAREDGMPHTTEGRGGRGANDPGETYMRDVRSCRRIAEHTRGVYTFFALLHRTLREDPAAENGPWAHSAHSVIWWETGRPCMRHYRDQHGWHAIRPDGAAEVAIGNRRMRFWLEWDRSTMGVRDLRAKFAAYAEYVQSREWRSDGNFPLPYLLIVTSEVEQETRICEALHTCMSTPTALRIFISTALQLFAHGPLAAVWRPWMPGVAPIDGRQGHICLGSPVWLFSETEEART